MSLPRTAPSRFISDASPLRLEILRFIGGGLTTLLVCLSSMWILVGLFDIQKMIALNLTAGVGYLYSYTINKIFVFRKDEESHLVYGSRYIILQLVLLAANNALFYVGIEYLHWHYLAVNCIIAVFISILNFIFMKFAVFR